MLNEKHITTIQGFRKSMGSKVLAQMGSPRGPRFWPKRARSPRPMRKTTGSKVPAKMGWKYTASKVMAQMGQASTRSKVVPLVFPDLQVNLYQNGWFFSISRFTRQKSSLRYQNTHFLESAVKSDPPNPLIQSVSSSQYQRIPRGLKLIAIFGQKSIFL